MTAVASLAEYGALHGVTKQAAARWKTRGYLVMQGDMVDVEASESRMRAVGKGRFNNSTKAVKQRIVAASTVNQDRQRSRPPSTSALASGVLDGSERADCYPYRDHLTDPGDRAAVALLPHTAYRIGGAAALAAHDLGLEAKTADRLRLQVATTAMEIVCMILDEAEIAPPPNAASWSDVPLFDPEKVSTVDWSRVA